MGLHVRGELTELRPATEDDVDLLVAWHSDPEVARFWGNRSYEPDEMLRRLRRTDVEAFVVEAAGRPIGYLQAWSADDAGAGGLDMFLVPSARGRGLGPDAARALARHLIDERGWTRVTVDPELWNERAVRAWTRAGFEPVEEREPDGEHDERWLLMVFRA